MQEYQNYFFSLIGAGVGQNANNWKAALESLPGMGMGTNPQPGQKQPLDAPHHGITVMIDAGGNARGRIWLPTDVPVLDDNGNAWFTHEIQVIADGPVPGSMVWAWDSKGGASAAAIQRWQRTSGGASTTAASQPVRPRAARGEAGSGCP